MGTELVLLAALAGSGDSYDSISADPGLDTVDTSDFDSTSFQSDDDGR